MVQIGVPESVLTAVTAFRMEWERPSAFMLAAFLSGKAGAYGQNAGMALRLRGIICQE